MEPHFEDVVTILIRLIFTTRLGAFEFICQIYSLHSRYRNSGDSRTGNNIIQIAHLWGCLYFLLLICMPWLMTNRDFKNYSMFVWTDGAFSGNHLMCYFTLRSSIPNLVNKFTNAVANTKTHFIDYLSR